MLIAAAAGPQKLAALGFRAPTSAKASPRSATSHGCTFIFPDGGLTPHTCWLPGTRIEAMSSGPCCYDRNDAGAVDTCLMTGTCSCNDAGNCQNDVVPYVCPFCGCGFFAFPSASYVAYLYVSESVG